MKEKEKTLKEQQKQCEIDYVLLEILKLIYFNNKFQEFFLCTESRSKPVGEIRNGVGYMDSHQSM